MNETKKLWKRQNKAITSCIWYLEDYVLTDKKHFNCWYILYVLQRSRHRSSCGVLNLGMWICEYLWYVGNLDICQVQSNLAIRNFLVILKLFLNSKCSLSLWSKLANWSREMVLITNFLQSKPTYVYKTWICIHKYM